MVANISRSLRSGSTRSTLSSAATGIWRSFTASRMAVFNIPMSWPAGRPWPEISDSPPAAHTKTDRSESCCMLGCCCMSRSSRRRPMKTALPLPITDLAIERLTAFCARVTPHCESTMLQSLGALGLKHDRRPPIAPVPSISVARSPERNSPYSPFLQERARHSIEKRTRCSAGGSSCCRVMPTLSLVKTAPFSDSPWHASADRSTVRDKWHSSCFVPCGRRGGSWFSRTGTQ